MASALGGKGDPFLDKEDLNFKKLSTKYYYPIEKIKKEEWLAEL